MSANHLGQETSPYLLQHKDNPVHWRAWGPEALREAKQTGKPILLSVGYAACHWCHVMAHESFEDGATAAVMNELFVNIKVDREERPDIDAIYMGALHKLGEQGGWPLTMFLDSEAKPFWGGTYFPPVSRWGKPGFAQVLREVARIYREDPDRVAHNTRVITAALVERPDAPSRLLISDTMLDDLTRRMVRAVDPDRGGLQGAPKFPQWTFFWLLWRGAIRYGNDDARAAVLTTLTNICQGGIYDHIGGGFARYSVDERWLIPHFEKMLYDNALLIDLLTEAWRETQNPLFRQRIEETIGWLQREMIAEGGGFAASLDADSEGEEGKFTVWSLAEVIDVLGLEDGRHFAAVYDITAEGNFEGHNNPNRLGSMQLLDPAEEARLTGMRAKLLVRRDSRIRPGWDDKVLADWNGLMIAALSRAAIVFRRPDWLAMAERAFAFVETRMKAGDGARLFHSFRARRAKAPATSSDYADMIWGAVRLYEATGQTSYLDLARAWTDTLDCHYWIGEGGGYATAADDTIDVIVRLRTASDDATPNANGVMITNLVHLFLLTGEDRYRARAEEIPQAFAHDVSQSTLGHCGLLAACLDILAPAQIVIVGGDGTGRGRLASALHASAVPGALEQILPGNVEPPSSSPLVGKGAVDGSATAYICIGTTCSAPTLDAKALSKITRSLRRSPGSPLQVDEAP